MNITSTLENVSPNSVVIGRGRRIKEHQGNLRFKAIVNSHLEGYANALTKTKKSLIILKILNEVRAESDANFVKMDSNGNAFEVEEAQARITIAQALRDNLNQYYRSSRQHKQRKRLQIKRASATAHQYFQSQSQQQNGTSSSLSLMRTMNMKPLELMREVSVTSTASSTSHADTHTSNCASIQDILDEAVGIATASTMPQHAVLVEEETVVMDDVFTSLFKAFAPSCAASNPFEPTPLAEHSEEGSYGSLEADWEPFPLAAILS